MSNPLLAFWYRLFGRETDLSHRPGGRIPVASEVQASATIFLIMRRMRAPLIVLITIFAVSVLGLTLVPGRTADGLSWRMSIFDAFYFMSYTASTIGFGELPLAFSDAQRLWVTVSIYLTVIGWAYAIGSLLALVQDRAFRQALALQHFTRKVSRLREPFLLVAGYGRTGELLGGAFDALGKRFVVLDAAEDRIEALELAAYHADVPGLVADARDPGHLGVAGLGNPHCQAVLALTNDDEANLAVTMSAALLRPDLPVIARTLSPAIAERMRAVGSPTVVNPFDRFGDHLRVALRAPASYQLMTWLESGPGAELPARSHPPREGRAGRAKGRKPSVVDIVEQYAAPAAAVHVAADEFAETRPRLALGVEHLVGEPARAAPAAGCELPTTGGCVCRHRGMLSAARPLSVACAYLSHQLHDLEPARIASV
jgi:voltage-gated potassium channel